MKQEIAKFLRERLFVNANEKTTFRKAVKEAETGPLKIVRIAYHTCSQASMPAPRWLWQPIWHSFQGISSMQHNLLRAAWVTPLYHTFCKEIGPGFVAGSFSPYVVGNGNVYMGENIKIMGKVDFVFPNIMDDIPELHIGSNTHIGHNVGFVVAKRITIGEHCLIASNIRMRDSNGHSMDPASRRRGEPPKKTEIKPVLIGNNVWIGSRAIIMPGVKIGDNCVIAAGTTVRRNIPPNHLVTPGPSKVIKMRDLSKMSAAATQPR